MADLPSKFVDRLVSTTLEFERHGGRNDDLNEEVHPSGESKVNTLVFLCVVGTDGLVDFDVTKQLASFWQVDNQRTRMLQGETHPPVLFWGIPWVSFDMHNPPINDLATARGFFPKGVEVEVPEGLYIFAKFPQKQADGTRFFKGIPLVKYKTDWEQLHRCGDGSKGVSARDFLAVATSPLAEFVGSPLSSMIANQDARRIATALAKSGLANRRLPVDGSISEMAFLHATKVAKQLGQDFAGKQVIVVDVDKTLAVECGSELFEAQTAQTPSGEKQEAKQENDSADDKVLLPWTAPDLVLCPRTVALLIHLMSDGCGVVMSTSRDHAVHYDRVQAAVKLAFQDSGVVPPVVCGWTTNTKQNTHCKVTFLGMLLKHGVRYVVAVDDNQQVLKKMREAFPCGVCDLLLSVQSPLCGKLESEFGARAADMRVNGSPLAAAFQGFASKCDVLPAVEHESVEFKLERNAGAGKQKNRKKSRKPRSANKTQAAAGTAGRPTWLQKTAALVARHPEVELNRWLPFHTPTENRNFKVTTKGKRESAKSPHLITALRDAVGQMEPVEPNAALARVERVFHGKLSMGLFEQIVASLEQHSAQKKVLALRGMAGQGKSTIRNALHLYAVLRGWPFFVFSPDDARLDADGERKKGSFYKGDTESQFKKNVKSAPHCLAVIDMTTPPKPGLVSMADVTFVVHLQPKDVLTMAWLFYVRRYLDFCFIPELVVKWKECESKRLGFTPHYLFTACSQGVGNFSTEPSGMFARKFAVQTTTAWARLIRSLHFMQSPFGPMDFVHQRVVSTLELRKAPAKQNNEKQRPRHKMGEGKAGNEDCFHLTLARAEPSCVPKLGALLQQFLGDPTAYDVRGRGYRLRVVSVEDQVPWVCLTASFVQVLNEDLPAMSKQSLRAYAHVSHPEVDKKTKKPREGNGKVMWELVNLFLASQHKENPEEKVPLPRETRLRHDKEWADRQFGLFVEWLRENSGNVSLDIGTYKKPRRAVCMLELMAEDPGFASFKATTAVCVHDIYANRTKRRVPYKNIPRDASQTVWKWANNVTLG